MQVVCVCVCMHVCVCVFVLVFLCVCFVYLYIFNTSKEQVIQYAVTNMVPVISNKLGFLPKIDHHNAVKGALYRIWCGVNRLGDSGVNRLSDTSALVIPAGQLLLPGGVRPECLPSA